MYLTDYGMFMDDFSDEIIANESDPEYKNYLIGCRNNILENERYIEMFDESLKAQGLAEKTRQRHLNNIVEFLDHDLLFDEAVSMKEGISSIYSSVTYFHVHKFCKSEDQIKKLLSSISKFYKCMFQNGLISEAELDFVKTETKWDPEYFGLIV